MFAWIRRILCSIGSCLASSVFWLIYGLPGHIDDGLDWFAWVRLMGLSTEMILTVLAGFILIACVLIGTVELWVPRLRTRFQKPPEPVEDPGWPPPPLVKFLEQSRSRGGKPLFPEYLETPTDDDS